MERIAAVILFLLKKKKKKKKFIKMNILGMFC